MGKIKERDGVREEDFEFLEGIPMGERDELLSRDDLITWDACSLYHKVGSDTYQRSLSLESWGQERIYRVPPDHRLYEVGDIMPVGQCEKGWEIEYVKESIVEEYGILEDHVGAHRTIFRMGDHRVSLVDGASIRNEILVKLVSKHDQEPLEEPEKAPEPKEEMDRHVESTANPTKGKSRDKEILEAVCGEAPINLQTFSFPSELLTEIARRIGGIPDDTGHDGSVVLSFYSADFNDHTKTLNIIRTMDGWKVEGT